MIPYGRQSINDADIAAVAEVLRGDWLTTGPVVSRFESAVAQLAGVEACVSVTSGTAALHCAYRAIGLGPGDEVITPPMTFVATQATAQLLGAEIVFADVEAGNGLIDPAKVAEKVTARTKAIVAVDYAGQPADMDSLRAIADECGAYLVEDAAHSIGAISRGRPVGSLADLTTFSFFPTKNLTTAEGGAVVGPDLELVERAREFHNHGLIRDPSRQDWPDEGPWHQEVAEFGLNYRLPDVLAALGLSQLERLEEFRVKRQAIVDAYSAAFSGVPGLDVLTLTPDSVPFWHIYPLRVHAEERLRIFTELRRVGVGVQVNYLPAHLHPAFRRLGFGWGDFPVAEEFYRGEISLPLYVDLPKDDVERVIDAVLKAASVGG